MFLHRTQVVIARMHGLLPAGQNQNMVWLFKVFKTCLICAGKYMCILDYICMCVYIYIHIFHRIPCEV